MNSMFSKLKSSATLWSVIGGFVLGIANIIWGSDTTASSIASAVLFAAPSVAYIVSKFALRIKLADVNNDGKISLQELAIALNTAASETSDDAQDVVNAFWNVIEAIAKQEPNEVASPDNGEGE